VATTLDADQELLHFSFPIEKQEDTDSINPVDGTPDIWIVGKATDGTVDADRQIVDPQWSAVALKEWAATGGNVRMSHDPKRPVGKGHDVQVTTDGHYVKSLICDPLAKHFVRTGVLNDYSVGISMPHIKFGPDKALDPRGAATGGIITGRPDGLSKIAELSVVDRGSNFSSKFQITRKSAGGGDDFGFAGEMVGSQEEIAKAAPPALLAKVTGGNLLTKGGGTDTWPAPDELVNVDLPASLSLSISPADIAKLNTLSRKLAVGQHYDDLALKAVTDAEAAVYKRDIDTATRRRLAADGKALPNLSYPIENAGDLGNAATLARSGHGDTAAARRLIARRAEELGVANPLDESDGVSKGGSLEEAGRALLDDVIADKAAAARAAVQEQAAKAEAEPEVTKDPEPEPKDKPVKKAKAKKKKLPPWLNKPADDDSGSDDSDDASKACKSVTDHLWTGVEGTSDIVCSKCHTTPAQAAGVAGTHDMTCAPVPELMESDGPASTKGATPASASGAVGESMKPVPAHREPDGAEAESFEADAGMADGDSGKSAVPDLAPDPEVAALLRFKATGADEDLGRLHDLTCPAFHPEQVAKYHPYADLGTLIDSGAWQRKTLAAAAGPLEAAMKAQETWQAALLLKTASPADLNDWRLELHKAFRDANPGPGSYPTPGCVSPQSYNRPVLTDGRSAYATDHGGPNTSPQVASSAPDAHSFDRPPLSSGHQSPSPSFMKASFEYPSEQGVPTQLSYAAMEKEAQRQALVRMHEHLSRQFPPVCPMALDGPQQAENHPVPQPAGIGKGEGFQLDLDAIAANPPTRAGAPVAALKAEPERDGLFMDADIYKGFKKQRKKLGKKVLSGSMTVDEARAKLGRQFAQKAAEPAITFAPNADATPGDIARIQAGLEKSAMAAGGKVLVLPPGTPAAPPAAASFGPADIEAAVTKAVAPLLEKIQQQDETYTTKLAEQQRVIDAIADQPDPSTAAFSGLAFQPQVIKSRRPAAVPDVAEAAARSQDMIRRNLEKTYYNHSDPGIREAAGQSLLTLGREAAP
jgi:hypothetical protein